MVATPDQVRAASLLLRTLELRLLMDFNSFAYVRQKQSGPGLWDVAGGRASDSLDATGNAALLESGIVHSLQASDIGVNDIFDPAQETQFHLIRKRLRSALLLATLFPATSAAIQDVR